MVIVPKCLMFHNLQSFVPPYDIKEDVPMLLLAILNFAQSFIVNEINGILI